MKAFSLRISLYLIVVAAGAGFASDVHAQQETIDAYCSVDATSKRGHTDLTLVKDEKSGEFVAFFPMKEGDLEKSIKLMFIPGSGVNALPALILTFKTCGQQFQAIAHLERNPVSTVGIQVSQECDLWTPVVYCYMYPQGHKD